MECINEGFSHKWNCLGIVLSSVIVRADTGSFV